jgi:hypothetical protein
MAHVPIVADLLKAIIFIVPESVLISIDISWKRQAKRPRLYTLTREKKGTASVAGSLLCCSRSDGKSVTDAGMRAAINKE